MKVAVDNTGPGVNCPIAIASMSSCRVNKSLATSSASKKANNTYPLPYNIAPTFKKVNNIFILPPVKGSAPASVNGRKEFNLD